MAVFSKKIYLNSIIDSDYGNGNVSPESYVQIDVDDVVIADKSGATCTMTYTLYGKASVAGTYEYVLHVLDYGDSPSSNYIEVALTTSMKKLHTLVSYNVPIEHIFSGDDYKIRIQRAAIFKRTGTLNLYEAGYCVPDSTYVTIYETAKLTSYPSKMSYGEAGTFVFDKSSIFRFEFADSGGEVQYISSEFTGSSVDVTVPIDVFASIGDDLTTCYIYEVVNNKDIYVSSKQIKVADVKCMITSFSATRDSTDANQVVFKLSGKCSTQSTARTVKIYTKETSANNYSLIDTFSVDDTTFRAISRTVTLSEEMAYKAYAVLSDEFTSYTSNTIRIYSKAYVFDVRTDHTGLALGGTAENANEFRVHWEKTSVQNLEAEGNITPTEITGIANRIYPVGSIYMSVNSTNPGTLFGGTWAQIRDTFLLSAGETYAAGATGGEATHMLTTSEMPSHTHTQNSHNHTQNAHTHTQNAHTHTQNSHNHSQNSHNHSPNGTTYYLGTSGDGLTRHTVSSGSGAANMLRSPAVISRVNNSATTASNQATTATNQNTTATNQNTTATNQATTATNQNTGGGGAHNNMPPYLAVYVWKRTA